MASPPRVAVVGGGIAGSLCALALRRHGAEPTIFDMGKRSLGGRLGSARRGGAALSHDRGAQFFCVTDPGSRLGQVVSFLEQNHLVAPWEGRFGVLGSQGGGFLPKEIVDKTIFGGMQRSGQEASQDGDHGFADDFCGFLAGGAKSRLYVGVPSMGGVCGHLASLAGVPVRLGAQVTDLRMDAGSWTVCTDSAASDPSDSGFHAVVVASHNPSLAANVVRRVAGNLQQDVNDGMVQDEGGAQHQQIVERLQKLSASLQELRDRHKAPVYSLSAWFPEASLSARLPFDATVCPSSAQIQFLAREASKPGRAGAGEELWTAISTPSFAQELLSRGVSDEEAATELGQHLTKLLAPALASTAGPEVPLLRSSVKRWRAGFTTRSLGLHEDSIGLEPWRLAICGDFLRGYPSPLEASVASGLEAGERVASWFADSAPGAQ